MDTQTAPYPPLERRPEFAEILRDNETFAESSPDESSRRINHWSDCLMIQSGLEMVPSVLLLLCLLSGIAVGGTLFVLVENLLVTSLGTAVGFLLPVLVALIMRNRRQSQIFRQMPAMVDELARAARTGRSLELCFQQVAADTPSPLGDELRFCARKMQMGVDLGSALNDLPARTGLVSLNIFMMALRVHQQTGGDLVHVLERLARTLRDRIAFQGRLRAATAASRATAILMIALPPLILGFFLFRDPAYFETLMASRWGRGTTLFALMLQIAGSLWVLRIMKTSQRL